MKKYYINFDNENSTIKPITCGYEECLKGHFFGPTKRNYYLIHFILSGTGTYTVNNKEYSLKANDIFIIKPNETTFYKASEDNPWQYVWVGFYCENDSKIHNFEYIYHVPELFSVFDEIENNLTNNDIYYFIASKICQIVNILSHKNTLPISYEEKAKQIIDTEFLNGIKIQDISKNIGIDRAYLSKLFKKKYSMSPEQYLVKKRMEKALEFLLIFHQSISMTCYSLGYNDIYVFSKLFKKYYGKSPRNYIKDIKNKAN